MRDLRALSLRHKIGIMRRRGIPVIGAVVMWVAVLMATAGLSRADTAAVGPGDTIVQGDTTCTLGYVFRRGGNTMGLTAGHCATGGTVVDTDAGVSGTPVGAQFVDEYKDWQLIDFGTAAARQRIGHSRYRITSMSAPTAGQSVCHYGSGSGTTSCGRALDVYGSSIAVTAIGVPGDSGGPCFVPQRGDQATAVGLWHGRDTKVAGLGYCVSLNAALRAFGERQRADA